MPNPLAKTRPVDLPYAVFSAPGTGWQWKVLKTYKAAKSEAKDQYARWLVWACSPYCPEGEMGDTYINEITENAVLTFASQEFMDAYPDLPFMVLAREKSPDDMAAVPNS
tara:strand:+ start:582 stop:911 length:330 start_codon:yes stop_codon:yes gene_type:complete